MPPAAPDLDGAADVGGAGLRAAFDAALDALDPPPALGLAVSGGRDSVALLHLAAAWAAPRGCKIVALTVDHGLRPEAAAEARQVAAWARAAGIPHRTLRHAGPRPEANLQAAARTIRYRLLGQAARRTGLGAIVTAHTLDDQAETVLLRLARGSGIDGAAAMRANSAYPDPGYPSLRLLRPLLAIRRSALTAHLEAAGQAWIDDPSNSDPRHARVRMRGLMAGLAAEGLTAERLALFATHAQRAQAALDAAAAALLSAAVRTLPRAEGVVLDRRTYAAAPEEIGFRALRMVLAQVARTMPRPGLADLEPVHAYPPRFARIAALHTALRNDTLGGGRTLAGCRIAPAARNAGGPHAVLIWPEGRRRPRPGAAMDGADETP